MNFLNYLQCPICGKEFDPNRLWNLCPTCSKPLIAFYNMKKVYRAVKREEIANRKANLWRYRELLPVQEQNNVLTMDEGFTPLIRATRLGEALGFTNLYIKEEGQNPTGSFKARGLAVALSRARELGIKEVSIPSLGNAAVAMSAYAALGGMKAYVFMPRTVPKIFVVECIAMGAQVQLVDGLIGDCGEAAAEGVKKFGRFNMSTLKEPYRLEGKKTMGYELAEQMGWQLPDVIIYPTGGGTGLIGMWKAFEELMVLGWIKSKMTKMVAVQAEGCAPIVRAFKEGKKAAEFWENPHTIADGLKVPATIGDFLILETLRESRGTAVTVTDNEIMDAIKLISSTQGIFVSPEGAATLAALKRLHNQGWLKNHQSIVLFNTATGSKYTHLWVRYD